MNAWSSCFKRTPVTSFDWTREPGIPSARLADAIDAVGPTIGAIRRHLQSA
jgi:hypothetical protein